jgi:AraC-like DNA-binding protein
MATLKTDFIKNILLFAKEDGMNATPIPGVYCVRYSKTDRPSKRHWRSTFAIVAQGCKEILLDQEMYRASDAHYTVTPIDLPVISKISSATRENPFLALLIDFNPLLLSEIEAQLEEELPKESSQSLGAIFKGKTSEQMLEAVVRLTDLFKNPEQARIIGPLIVRELFYYLLVGPNGNEIRHFVRSGNKMQKIAKAIYKLKSELDEELNTEAMAKAASMSRSAFFKSFKDVTSMGPIQYQKKLRLLEAKRLMLHEDETAENAGYRVGYKSSSQFNREYSRMFGASPIRDTKRS